MSHRSDDELAIFINKYYTPQDLKISRKIFPNQTDSEGTCMVYIRLRRYNPHTRKDEKEKKIPTGVRVKPKSWSSKKGEVLKSDFKWQQKNRTIQDKESDIRKYVSNPDGEYIFAQLKKEEFIKIEQVFPTLHLLKYQKNLVHYIEEYYSYRKKLGHAAGTVKEFKTVMNRVKNFDDDNNRITYLKDIDLLWSDAFELWMTGKKYSQGTIEKTYTILKTVLNYYYERRKQLNIQLSEDFKYKSFKRGKKSKNKPNPLSYKQVMFLYNYRFTEKEKHFETIRKMVLIQCFTGCRYNDIKRFRPSNFENKGWLIFMPTKTSRYDIEASQPLNKYADALFKEVNYDTSGYKMQNQPYNRAIQSMLKNLAEKDDCKELQFKTNHTSHNFRDTFISQAVQSGINFKSIITWVGQSSYSIMDRYIDLSPEFNKREMSKLYKSRVLRKPI
ncbi:MAG TPA: phage integrase SAM-like domain-containing protein [Bacteroidales bacterium]|nr:phage integrase SAM-like domain-containing protein [Bacteroidales bacterium]